MSTTVESRVEYARAVRALERAQLAITMLESSRSAALHTFGDQRVAVRYADEAILAAKRMAADLEHALNALGRAL